MAQESRYEGENPESDNYAERHEGNQHTIVFLIHCWDSITEFAPKRECQNRGKIVTGNRYHTRLPISDARLTPNVS